MANVKLLNVLFTLSCFVGLALSIYSYVVEQAAEKDENYKAMCDINDFLSCTKVFKTEYAKGFGIFGKFLGEDSALNKPNSLAGMIFYSLLILLAQKNSKPFAILTLLGSLASILVTVYLAFILVFVIKSICVVCVSTYFVNFINLLCSYYKYKTVSAEVVPVIKSRKSYSQPSQKKRV